ncbi:MAG: hypothetical protein ACREN2_11605 [Candidatus Dormibacteria bacterium]
MHRRFLLLSAAAAATAAALVPAAVASAHAVIKAGSYHVAMGWQFETNGGTVTYVDQPNAVQVFVDTLAPSGDIGTPVGDLNADCNHPDFQVTVTYAGKTGSPLCPGNAFDADTGLGRMDEYDAPLTPTKVGDYTFHITGTIHGAKIDQSVMSSDKTFASVADQGQVEFPVAAPALNDVASKVDQVSSRAQSASNDASRGTILGVIAIVIAVVLGGAALGVTLRRRS